MAQSTMKVSELAMSSMKAMSSAAKTSFSNVKGSKETGFGDVLSKSSASAKSIGKADSTKKTQDTVPAKNDAYTKAQGALKNETSQTSDTAGKVVQTDSSTVEEVVIEVGKAVDKVFDGLKEQIADILGVNQDELEKMMAETGMTVMDLLNIDNLKQLLFIVNDVTDSTQLLTNENLLTDLNTLAETAAFAEESLADLQTQYTELIPEEQFAAILNKAAEPKTEMTQETAEETTEPNVQADTSQKTPVITVEREESFQDTRSDSDNKGKGDSLDANAAVNQFVNNLADAVSGVEGTQEVSFSRLQEMQNIVEQVVEQIKVKLSGDSTSMEMQLNPEQLGKVHVSVVSKAGQMTATFAVENQIAKEALESQLVTLKDNLSEQGLKVDVVEVTISQHGFDQNSFSGQQNEFSNPAKKHTHAGSRSLLEEDETTEEETDDNETEGILPQGGTVDYSA